VSRRLVVALAAAGLACAGSALAQARRPAPAGEGRAEAWKMVDAYIMGNLQESLGLTDEQFVKILPLVKKLQKDRREFLQRRRETLQELRRELASGTATEARIQEQLKALKTLEADEPALIRKDLDAVDASLSTVQQAKFRVMEVEIEARIRQMLNRVRQQRQKGAGKGPLAPVPDEDPEP